MDTKREQIGTTTAPLHNFSLDSFSRAHQRMIATNDTAYSDTLGGQFSNWRRRLGREYSDEEIQNIIEHGSLEQQQQLSRNYFYKDGYYKQIIIHYATLLTYMGLLIPNPSVGKSLSTSHIQKRYISAMEFVENMSIPTLLTNCALRALIDGSYYGIRAESDKKTFALIDLPGGYARSRFKDLSGQDVVEFDLSYFKTITDENSRKAALAAYPKIVSKAYKEFAKGKRDKWLIIPSPLGVCFPFFDGHPLFLSVIPATIKYDEAIVTERERDADEIRKIIVQKIPHLTDGRLLFEPEEMEEIHYGTVQMMKGNPNVSVLTTYADVDAITSKTAADHSESVLDKMEQNIYAQAGVSGQIFSPTGSGGLQASLTNDLALMMYLANKFSSFITALINEQFANGNIDFKYTILPISWHNQSTYADTAFKMANFGYSFLMPAMAMGLTQRDLGNLKDLENFTLNLGQKLIPLQSSYTQKGEDSSGGQGQNGNATESPLSEEGGRPRVAQERKAERTIDNEVSLDKTGGGS